MGQRRPISSLAHRCRKAKRVRNDNQLALLRLLAFGLLLSLRGALRLADIAALADPTGKRRVDGAACRGHQLRARGRTQAGGPAAGPPRRQA